MSDEDVARERHDEQWPWCRGGTNPHSHSESIGDGPRVNGYPAGPMWQLRDRQIWEPEQRS